MVEDLTLGCHLGRGLCGGFIKSLVLAGLGSELIGVC